MDHLMNEWDVGNASPVKTDLVVVVFVSSGVHWYNIFETPFIRSLVKTIEDSLCVVVASESGRLNGTELWHVSHAWEWWDWHCIQIKTR